MVIVILLIIVFGLVFYLLKMNKNLKTMQSKLSLIRTKNLHTPLRAIDFSKQQRELVNEINLLIESNRDSYNNYVDTLYKNKQMISAIAHDFRTPLTSIIGYIQMSKSDAIDEQQRAANLDIVEKRASNLNDLINDFYEISLLDSDEFPLNFELFNPYQHINELLSTYIGELEKTYDEIQMNFDESDFRIYSSKNAMNRIVSNLIKNSLIHGSKFFYIDMHSNNDDFIIKIGNYVDQIVSAEDLDKIFERTYRIDYHRKFTSSGLGLAISKNLANKINGNLIAEYDNFKITFTLTLKNQ